MSKQAELLSIYSKLLEAFGHRNWWPADGPFEVIVGAILTQNVSWKNAARAIANLKAAGKLDPLSLYKSSPQDIAPLIKPSRFYNMKALKIKNFLDFFFWGEYLCPYRLVGVFPVAAGGFGWLHKVTKLFL